VVYCDDVWKNCFLAKLSLDMKLLALQRSPTKIEVGLRKQGWCHVFDRWC